MPRIKLPIQPSTCACPCAWIQAGEMLSAARRSLMEIRFHTPRNVPGSNMNSSPPEMKNMSKRESWTSRALVRAKICSGVSGSLARV